MKRILSLFLAVALLLGSATLLVSCGTPKDDGAQIAIYLTDMVYDLDPTDFYVSSNAEQVMSLLFEPLFRLDKKGNVEKAMAKSYKIDKTERKIVIKLRESYWSNGTRVQAADYVYAWRDRIMDPARSNPAAALFYDIENAIEVKNGTADLYDFGVNATNIYELTIKYREGADVKQLLRNLASVATSPVSNATVESTPFYWSKVTTTAVVNGPFMVKSYEASSGVLTLTRNLGYHQKTTEKNFMKNVTPYMLVHFNNFGEDVALTYEQIENDTVFYMGNATLESRKASEKEAIVADKFATYSYLFNTENPLFADANVRRALSLALDRQAMADAVVFAKPATALHVKSSGLIGGADMDGARAALAAANLGSTPKTFTLTVNDDEASVAVAELAKAAWEELGFTVTIDAVDFKKTVVAPGTEAEYTAYDSQIQYLVKNAAEGNCAFDVIGVDLQLYSADPAVILSAFTTTMNGNGASYATNIAGDIRGALTGFSNEEYDALMTTALTKSGSERAEALAAAEALLVEKAPVVPVLFEQNFAFVSKKLSGVKADGNGNFVLTKASLKHYQDYLPKDDKKEDEAAD